jgi:luciferase family oxidoreductase group 1
VTVVPLSVLDLAPVPAGGTSRQALADTVALARRVEQLGYRRFWVAEHHGMPGVASSAPAVLVGAVAAATSTLRVGSGGVMLPNHPPLVVAEQFGTLEALHPGRIDLGIGRAPGTDPGTAAALRRTADPMSVEDFPAQLQQLRAFFAGSPDSPASPGRLRAVPAEGNAPQVWLLGSSGYSAQVAGLLGLPFAFAHHFSAQNTVPALELYRSRFTPSQVLEQPHSAVCVSVVCAPTSSRAHELALPGALSFLRLRAGRPGLLPSPQETAAHPWTAAEREWAATRAAEQAVGDPEQVATRLAELVCDTGADELIATTMVHDPADRLRSFELLAGLGVRDEDGLALPQPVAAR